MAKGSNLTVQQEKALAALVANASQSAAAKSAGVSDVTIWRWLKLPHFRERLESMRHDATGAAIGMIQTNSIEAATALLAIVKDPKATANARVAASRAILEFALRTVETETIGRGLNEMKILLRDRELNKYE